MNAVELAQKRIDEQTRKLDEDVTHVMFCHSGSKYDLTCTVPNCEYASIETMTEGGK